MSSPSPLSDADLKAGLSGWMVLANHHGWTDDQIAHALSIARDRMRVRAQRKRREERSRAQDAAELAKILAEKTTDA
jgi:hypothetical protein